MRAVQCVELGGPEKLVLRDDIESPAVGDSAVKIKVRVAALSFVDLLQSRGLYQYKPDIPFVPGSHAAGDVIAVGKDVTRVRPGDRVTLFARTGAFAEEMVTDESLTYALPDAIDYETGAAYRNAYGTGLHALRDRAGLAAGETLLVHGAAGGVGLAAVDLGRAMGARVIATVGSDEKAAIVREYGAEAVINYTNEDIVQRVRDLTGGSGADVILDPVGGAVFDASLRCINWGGRLLVVGFASGTIPKAPANLPLLKGCAIVGVSYGGFQAHEPDNLRALHETLLAWIAEGRIHPHVSHRFPLENVTEALTAMAERRATGRVVLTVAS
jgi:NADPH2:quinone reductase